MKFPKHNSNLNFLESENVKQNSKRALRVGNACSKSLK